MVASRISDILDEPLAPYSDQLERQGSWLEAVRNAYLLDTSIGQATQTAALMNAFGVPMHSLYRRVQPGYSPFDPDEEDLTGFEPYYDEFTRSTSPEETRMIKAKIENNLDMRLALDGWGGTRLFAGLLDPINLIPVPFALGKGFAAGAKVALERGVPIVAGTELARHAMDPTSTAEETIFATLGGSLFMGLVGGAVGTVPRNTMTVGEALGRLTPPAGTTSMFAGMPYHVGSSSKSIFSRMTAALKSGLSYGDPIWKQVDPESVTVRVANDVVDDAGNPVRILQIAHQEGGMILQAVVRGTDELRIAELNVTEALRKQGIVSFALRRAIQFAEDNKLRLTSDVRASDDVIKIWKGFEEEGFNIHENKEFETDVNKERTATNDKPLFEMRQQIDPDAAQIPQNIRDQINDFELSAKNAKKALSDHKAYLRELVKEIKKLQKKAEEAKTAGGAKTKAQRKVKEAKEELKTGFKNRHMLEEQAERTETEFKDLNVRVALMLDEGTIKNWDLLPTGYNKILGKLNQFPWWRLMQNPLRDIAPDLGVRLQVFALKMAATPGLNNLGNRLGHTTGPSVESLSKLYTGKWLAATIEAQRLYRMYMGHGKSSSQVKHFIIDQSQRVRGRLNRWTGSDAPASGQKGRLTVGEFEDEISVAIINNGKHPIPEVAKAASGYIKVLDKMGKEGRKFNVFGTQQNLLRQIKELNEEIRSFDERWGKVYDIEAKRLETLDAEFVSINEKVVASAKELGVENPQEYVNLTRRVLLAEKDNELKTVDPVTGKELTARELMQEASTERLGEPLGVGEEFSRRRGYTEQEIADWNKWIEETNRYINGDKKRSDDFFTLTADIQDSLNSRAWSLELDKKPLPPGLRNGRDSMILRRMDLEDRLQNYKETSSTDYLHRMWIAEEVKLKEVEVKAILRRHFQEEGAGRTKEDGTLQEMNAEVLEARVNEAYAGILHEADNGNNGQFNPNTIDKRPWLESRLKAIEEGEYKNADGSDLTPLQAQKMIEIIERKLERIKEGASDGALSGPLVARRLNLDNEELLRLGVIESNVNTWVQHYVSRVAPMIETARTFGSPKAQRHIDKVIGDIYERAMNETDPAKRKVLLKEYEELPTAMQDLRDIVHGVYQIPDNPDAITPRFLRMLRNFNILGAMGRSVFMAMGDLGNVVVSQGFRRSIGYAAEHFASGITDGNIAIIRKEVDLAGSVSEVILGQRYHQMTDFGEAVGSSRHPRFSRIERGVANLSQRFFLYNLLGPWTDMARRFSGGMLQSRLIENSLLWKQGVLPDDQVTIMGRLGISKQQAIQFADEWEASGQLKHGQMFIANTTDWLSEQAVRTFRAALNTEIDRMVPTPGAVDKPKGLLKSEWWKVIGQYRGFSIGATHRIMGAGLQTKGATKFSGLASMVGIAMMVDALKRPDYMEMPIEEQLLRAVELSAVTGIILDVNDTIERASAGSIGIRPLLGMDIRERNPNWSNRIGTLGAVPNQWLTLMYGIGADEAETDDLARAIRYMLPYNNLLWWNEAFNRAQRSSVDFIEDLQ